MTKKHFKALAAALAGVKPESVAPRRQWVADVESVADALGSDNPRFDRDRFIAACEGGAA